LTQQDDLVKNKNTPSFPTITRCWQRTPHSFLPLWQSPKRRITIFSSRRWHRTWCSTWFKLRLYSTLCTPSINSGRWCYDTMYRLISSNQMIAYTMEHLISLNHMISNRCGALDFVQPDDLRHEEHVALGHWPLFNCCWFDPSWLLTINGWVQSMFLIRTVFAELSAIPFLWSHFSW
jgi:hypothetical protein